MVEDDEKKWPPKIEKFFFQILWVIMVEETILDNTIVLEYF